MGRDKISVMHVKGGKVSKTGGIALIVIQIISIFLFALTFSSCYKPIIGTKIYCPKCHRHLYTYTGEISKLKEFDMLKFVPNGWTTPEFYENQNVSCPYDTAPLNGYKYWFWERKRPLPNIVYRAETFMTKDSSGKFYYTPFEVDLKD